ncbi:DNA polymerase III subunit beta [Aliidiomarina quisquiliarum]|uniref:DNA polymerase III subunit beta n=1 Tax=Aliidiomarina quisquiliarum TaxID=2938947 RepID=UPI00208FF8D5|nr:DNA polymerase III subunit beta [Aliidiomarina quisquiliarum]MCO4319986.1 DNA polymerase III subunit beta [Aliidiomarina quisquiliarum]
MSITIELDGKELNTVSASVCRLAISGGKAHEIFGYVRLIIIPRSGGVSAFLSGSNGAQTLTRPICVSVDALEEEKTLLMSASKLQQISTAYKDSDKPVKLKIEPCGSKGVFSSGRSKMKMELADPSTYPSPPKIDGEFVTVTLPLETFVSELSKAKHAASMNSPRAFCNGVNLSFAQGSMSIISTDGHRMFKSVMANVEVEGSSHPSVIVPTHTLDYVCTIQDAPDSVLVLRLNKNMVEFTSANAQVRTTLIDCEYPNVSNIFDSIKSPIGLVNRESLMRVLSRIKPITDDVGRLDMDFEDGEIIVKAVDSTGAIMGEDALSFQSGATAKKIRLSCRYLLDALTNIDGDEVTLGFDEQKNFLTLNPLNRSDQTAIVMPMAR